MAVNFSKNQDDITRAWREVVDSNNTPKWALFSYEGSTNVIKLMATGSNGLDELVEEFNCSLIQYAFCRVIDESLGLNRLVLINWQGDSAPLSRKGLCASHVGDVTNYFKGCAQTITIRNDDEATKEHLMEQILKSSASKLGFSRISSQTSTTTTTTTTNDNGTSGPASIRTLNDTNDSSSADVSVSSSTEAPSTTTSSVYKKADIGSDIAASRKSFWQRQEEEEKERLAEEKRRAAEKQAQFEKERKQREELEAKKLAETIRQREELIEATKRADKLSESSTKQPSSIVSTTTANDSPEDDGRVGRRSELIRLERNQETQSLISKGLIKNKRAIFEQAQQQHQQQQPAEQQLGINRGHAHQTYPMQIHQFSQSSSSGPGTGNSDAQRSSYHVDDSGNQLQRPNSPPIEQQQQQSIQKRVHFNDRTSVRSFESISSTNSNTTAIQQQQQHQQSDLDDYSARQQVGSPDSMGSGSTSRLSCESPAFGDFRRAGLGNDGLGGGGAAIYAIRGDPDLELTANIQQQQHQQQQPLPTTGLQAQFHTMEQHHQHQTVPFYSGGNQHQAPRPAMGLQYAAHGQQFLQMPASGGVVPSRPVVPVRQPASIAPAVSSSIRMTAPPAINTSQLAWQQQQQQVYPQHQQQQQLRSPTSAGTQLYQGQQQPQHHLQHSPRAPASGQTPLRNDLMVSDSLDEDDPDYALRLRQAATRRVFNYVQPQVQQQQQGGFVVPVPPNRPTSGGGSGNGSQGQRQKSVALANFQTEV
uniref:Drebrin-like protein n=1 Tax=Aceria tosichella TaxID=561515 RepID=A0A6G1SMF4_9ACAR